MAGISVGVYGSPETGEVGISFGGLMGVGGIAAGGVSAGVYSGPATNPEGYGIKAGGSVPGYPSPQVGAPMTGALQDKPSVEDAKAAISLENGMYGGVGVGPGLGAYVGVTGTKTVEIGRYPGFVQAVMSLFSVEPSKKATTSTEDASKNDQSRPSKEDSKSQQSNDGAGSKSDRKSENGEM